MHPIRPSNRDAVRVWPKNTPGKCRPLTNETMACTVGAVSRRSMWMRDTHTVVRHSAEDSAQASRRVRVTDSDRSSVCARAAMPSQPYRTRRTMRHSRSTRDLVYRDDPQRRDLGAPGSRARLPLAHVPTVRFYRPRFRARQAVRERRYIERLERSCTHREPLPPVLREARLLDISASAGMTDASFTALPRNTLLDSPRTRHPPGLGCREASSRDSWPIALGGVGTTQFEAAHPSSPTSATSSHTGRCRRDPAIDGRRAAFQLPPGRRRCKTRIRSPTKRSPARSSSRLPPFPYENDQLSHLDRAHWCSRPSWDPPNHRRAIGPD